MSFLGAMFKSIEVVDRAALAEKTSAQALERASLAEKQVEHADDVFHDLPSDELPFHDLPSDELPFHDLPSDELPSDDVPEIPESNIPRNEFNTPQDKINDERTALELVLSKNPSEPIRTRLQTQLDALPKTDTRGLYHKVVGAPFSGTVQRGLDSTLEGAPGPARNYIKSVAKDLTTNLENVGNAARYKAVGVEPPAPRAGAFDAAGGKGPLHMLTGQPIHKTVSVGTEVARDTSIKVANVGLATLKRGAIIGGGLVVATGAAYGAGSQVTKKVLG
jgi:hypothetical protein